MSTEEFKKAIKDNCTGKKFAEFPGAFKQCIEGFFKTIDVDGTSRLCGPLCKINVTTIAPPGLFFMHRKNLKGYIELISFMKFFGGMKTFKNGAPK